MSLGNIVNKTWNNFIQKQIDYYALTIPFSFRQIRRRIRNTFRNITLEAIVKASVAASTLSPIPIYAAQSETRYKESAKGLNASLVNSYNYSQDEFIAQPELGYVIKSEEKTEITPNELSLYYGAKEIKPIGGNRKGFSIVHSNYGIENEEIIKILKTHPNVKYAAPLFLSNGETIAIIPEIVAKLKNETDYKQLEELCANIGLNIKRKLMYTNTEYLIDVLGNDENSVFKALEQLTQSTFIEWAAPNIAFQPKLCAEIPNDRFFIYQWHLHNPPPTTPPRRRGTYTYEDINAPEAWEFTTGDPNIVVAVLDTGVDYNHEDLKENIWKNLNEIPDNKIDDDRNGYIDDFCGWDIYDYDNSPFPSLTSAGEAHGTAIAGLIAAQGNNNIGVSGVTWNCKIMPIRIRGPPGGDVTDADTAEGFRYAAKNGADILNCSWGFMDSPIHHSAIKDITSIGGIGRKGKGCIVMASSGNDGVEGKPIHYPAKYPEVIAVGATDSQDKVWDYSSYGPELDLVAPSGGTGLFPGTLHRTFMWTTDISGSVGYNSYSIVPPYGIISPDYADSFWGTSASSAVASGVAALVLSVNPNLTNSEVRSILSRSAKDLGDIGWDQYYGNGRVDAYAAVVLALTELKEVEGFETGDFSQLDWRHYGNANWLITSSEKNSGTYSAQPGYINDDENSSLETTLDCIAGEISFYRKVSSEEGCDYLQFYIDGVKRGEWSGNKNWEKMSYLVNEGRRTFTWTYSKDSSISEGYDSAWLDDVGFPRE